MTVVQQREARLPPRWVVRSAWYLHRALYRVTGGRLGLRRARADQWGMMRLTTLGRRSGQPRSVMLGYFEDGPNVVTLAMNGWADPEPAWWLNLQAHPEATLQLSGRTIRVIGRKAEGSERQRLWDAWRHYDKDLDAFAARRSRETAVVVLEPQQERRR